MKLKQATQLAIIGVILQLIPSIMWFLVDLKILEFSDKNTYERFWYFKYLGIIGIIGTALLLSFFVTLFKSQK